jgi:twinkle protein
MDSLDDFVREFTSDSRENCPACSSDRKKKNQKTLSISVKPDAIVYMCWHCGISGGTKRERFYEAYMDKPKVTKIPTQLNSNVDTIKEFFQDRGVNLTDLNKLPRITTGRQYFNSLGEERDAVGFVYGDCAEPQAIKWRAVGDKAFTSSGAARSFYGVDQLEDDDELIIVEGECDVIALASVGIRAVSCPNGAPAKVSQKRVDPEEDTKFSYIWEERDRIERCKKIILATDNDAAGEALAEEIARRVGRAKCWRVQFPDAIKDANDAVRSLGADQTRAIFAKPTPVPLSGVYGAESYRETVKEIYSKGHGRGTSTGIAALDNLFTIAEGQLSVVTGHPGSGKSEMIDQIMINLAENNSWKFAVCSFENPPAVHIAKLLEKVISKPFYGGLAPRMSEDEVEKGIDFIDSHFVFLESKDGGMATIDSVIDRTRQAVMRLGVRGLVIDPYNYIDMGSDESEHTQISYMLSKITSFAKAHGIHVWFVAHPQKMYPREDGSYSVPKGMNISGSAAWFAKADLGITVHRTEDLTEVHCWKSRFKWVGQVGVEMLKYDTVTGQFGDPPAAPEKSFADKYGRKKSDDWSDCGF